MSPAPVERVVAYIDGFSVYYGLSSKGWRRLLWLDYRALLERLMRPPQTLVGVNYFTARVRRPPESRVRQITYLEALAAHGGVQIHEGKFEDRSYRCQGCQARWAQPKEKMTDVKLAVELVLGAVDDAYDTAVLVCADADLVPAVEVVRQRYGKQVLVVSPPGRTSDELARAGNAHLHFNRASFTQCQLPDPVVGPAWTYEKPAEWQ